jgi:fatty acid desaturase
MLSSVVRPSAPHEYAELKRLVKQYGLLDAQPRYYAGLFLFVFALFGLGLAPLFITHSFLFLMLDALYLGFVSMQFALLTHDIGHQQVFRSRRVARVVGLLIGNLLVGWSLDWWIDKHNAHHGHPNQVGLDPDIVHPVNAFDEKTALSRTGARRFLTKYQGYLVFPMYMISFFGLLFLSIMFLRQGKSKNTRAEVLLLILHYGLYLALLCWRLEFWQVIPFVLLHHAFFGMYLGSIGAPNHKGMPLGAEINAADFLRQQVLTSRNVYGSRLIDFWYGGLNFQIEHHLFPTMPRNKLRQARPHIKAFCAAHGVDYCETTLAQSYIDIVRYMHKISAPLRAEQLG